MKQVDVAIIGAGSGGLSARREIEKMTQNYVIIDGGQLGTTCARVGCMPSKVLIQVAEDYHRRHKLSEEGIHGGEHLTLDTRKVMAHVRKLRDRFVRGVLSGMDTWGAEKLIRGYAKFVDDNTLEVNGEQYNAKKIIIASGTKPAIPDVFNDFKDFIITTDEFFELETLPDRVAIIGLGVIGIELGQALSRLGVETIGIARRENIAGITDPRLNEYVLRKFSEQMNLSFTGIQSVSREGERLRIQTKDKEFVTDKVLVTSGRVHSLDKLEIEKTSAILNSKGLVDFCPRTFIVKGTDHLFIVGDVTGEKQILHEASDEGRIAGYNAVHTPLEFKTRTPLTITFCDPNIAFAGLTYKELKEKEIEFEVGEVLFEGQGRSIVKLKEIGMLRVYGDKKTGEILGAELFAPDGEHLAHLLSWIIEQKLDVNKVLSMPFYHPVVEEGLRTALRDLRDKLNLEQPALEVYTMEL